MRRREFIVGLGAAAWPLGLPSGVPSQVPASSSAAEQPLLMDGHVHITNRIYWEGIDPWQPIGAGWDYARARADGVNCIIDNLGTYGYWNYNYMPPTWDGDGAPRP